MDEFDPETEIEALIETFGAGFDDYDTEAITACFAYPAVVWQLGKGHVFADRAEMAENAGALLKAYEEAGIVSSAFDIAALNLTETSALASVAWECEDGEGVVVMEFSADYHLVRAGGDWRIAMIVNVDPDEEDDGAEEGDDED